MDREKRNKIETDLIKEHFTYFRDFTKMLTLLSGAMIPALLSLSQNITPAPKLLQFAALGHLLSLIVGLSCLWVATRHPLAVVAKSIHEATQDHPDHPNTVKPWEYSLPSRKEQLGSNIQIWIFGLSFFPVVLYLFLR